MLIDERRSRLLRLGFESLIKNHKVESFRTRKLSELAQMVLYQWSIAVKLNKISSRYSHNVSSTSLISNKENFDS